MSKLTQIDDFCDQHGLTIINKDGQCDKCYWAALQRHIMNLREALEETLAWMNHEPLKRGEYTIKNHAVQVLLNTRWV